MRVFGTLAGACDLGDKAERASDRGVTRVETSVAAIQAKHRVVLVCHLYIAFCSHMVLDGSKPPPSGMRSVSLLAGSIIFATVNWVGHALGLTVPVFCATLLMFIFLYGFRESERPWPGQEKKLSAYSVFNEGFKELPGTLNAAGVDRQMRGGSTLKSGGEVLKAKHSVHNWGAGKSLGTR